MHAAKLKTATKKSLLTKKSTALQNSTKRDPLVEKVSRMGNTRNPKEHAAVLKHAPANQQASNQQLLLMLQQQYGNDYVNQVLELAQGDREEALITSEAEPTEQPVVQAKMAMGQVGDKYEQEADRTAHQVIQKMSESETVSEEENRVAVEEETEFPQIQQKCGCGDKDESVQRKSDNTLQSEETAEDAKNEGSMEERSQTDALDLEDAENEDLIIQRKSNDKNTEATPDLKRSLQQQKGKGQPLANPLKQQMESAFGKDFSGVKIHADTEAERLTRSIKARAFTIGKDIFFRQGEYTPRSKQGQELLAHELTHVVQQGGSGDKSSEDAGVKVSEVPEDVGIQRACAQCEEEKAEGMIQAKEAPGANPEREASADLCNESASQESTQEATTEENVETTSEENNPSDSCDGSASQESAQETPTEGDNGCGSGSNNSSALCDENPSQDSAPSCDDEPECEQEDEQEETPEDDDGKCPSEEEAPPEPEPENDSSESKNNSTSRMGADVASDIIHPKQDEETTQPEATSGNSASTCASLDRDTSASTSQISEPQVNLSDASTNQLEPSDNSLPKQNSTTGEVTNPAFVAEKAQPITNATESQGQLSNKNLEISRLATLKINFKLPKQQETGKGNNVVNLEKQRATANSMATDFFAEAGSRLQTVTGLGQSISDRIYGAAENAKAAVMSAVNRQKDTIVERVNQQRAGLQNQTQATLDNIEQQYQELLPKIFQETKTISQTIQEQYANTLDKLNGIKSDVHKSIAGHYAETIENYRHIGKVTGQTAIDKGEEKAQGWESEKKQLSESEKNINFTQSGPAAQVPTASTEERKNRDLQTKADTAREVAQKYKEEIESTIEEQIKELEIGKEKDFQNICCAIKKIKIQLENGREKHIESLDKFQQDRVQQLEKSVTKLRQCVRQYLQKNLEFLDKQEVAHLQILQGYADRQISTIEENSQKAIASLQNGINQAVTKLIATLQNYHDEMQGIEVPDPEALSTALAATLGQLDSNISAVQGQTEKAIVAAIEGINSGEQQVVNAVSEIAQSAITELETFNQEISNGFIQIEQDITGNFEQFLDDYTKTANREFAEKTQKCLDGIADKVETSLNCTADKIGKALTDSVSELYSLIEEKTLGCLDTDIENYAERAVIEKKKQAAAMIAIILGSVLVLGLIGFVGHILLVGFLVGVLAAGTTLATILSGVIIGVITGVLGQLYANAILGKDLSEDLLLAAFLGGIFGALGGAIAGKLPIANNIVKYGLEQTVQTGLEVASEAYGSLLKGEPITTESLVLAGVIGGVINLTTTPIPTSNKGDRSADLSSTNPDIDTGNIHSDVNTNTDINAGNIRSDLDTETSRGLNRETNVLTTQKQQKVLENTASKRGDELTSEELNTELDVAGKAKPESINDGEFIEQRKLPNGHEWKEKEDGTWCRFSGKGDCMPGVEPNDTNQNTTSRKRKIEQVEESDRFQIDELQLSNANPNQTVVKNNIFDLYSELDRLKFDTFKEFLQHLTNISKSNNRLDDLREMIGEHEFTDIDFQEAKNSTKLRRSERNTQSSEQSKSEVFIQYLKHQLGLNSRESSEDFTANLIYVLGGQKPSPRQGSFGDLQVNITDTNITISGRPSFAKYTQEIKEVKPGQHRRHITAWHTMREAMQKYLNQTDVVNRDSQLNKLWNDSAIEEKIKNEAIQIIKDKTPELQSINDLDVFQKLSLENKVKALLFIMNSNSDNLWIGKGYVNTAINTAFKKINDDLDKLNNSNDLENLREEYETAEHNLGKGDRNTKQKKVIDEIEGIVAKFIRVKTKDNPEIKMKNLQKEVKEFLLNFEVDLLGSDAQFTDKDWESQFDTKIKYAEVGIAINQILLGIDNNSLEDRLKFLLQIDN